MEKNYLKVVRTFLCNYYFLYFKIKLKYNLLFFVNMLYNKSRRELEIFFGEKYMKLILYSIIAFLVSLTIQIVSILIINIRKNKKNQTIDVEKEYKRNMKLVIKILIAVIISFIIAIITLYALGITTIGLLRQGH